MTLLSKKMRSSEGRHLLSRPGYVLFCLLTCLCLVKDGLQQAFQFRLHLRGAFIEFQRKALNILRVKVFLKVTLRAMRPFTLITNYFISLSTLSREMLRRCRPCLRRRHIREHQWWELSKAERLHQSSRLFVRPHLSGTPAWLDIIQQRYPGGSKLSGQSRSKGIRTSRGPHPSYQRSNTFRQGLRACVLSTVHC